MTRPQLFTRAAPLIDAPSARAFVPGRIEVLGKHTDYCGGRSLLAAVDRGLAAVASPRGDGQIRVIDADGNREATFAFSPDLQPAAGHWSNYPQTVARRLARNFPGRLIGANIAIASNLPMAAGLSSSSAVVVAVFLVLRELNRLDQHPAYRQNIQTDNDVAAYCGTIENGQTFANLAGDLGVGTFGGSQDHTAILGCRANTISQFSFCPVRREAEIAFPDELTFVIANSGVIAEKTGDALAKYNAVAGRARAIVQAWNRAAGQQAAVLRDVPGEVRSLLDADLTLRLEQFQAESGRLIPQAALAMASHRWQQLGEIVDESQRLAESHLGNQIPQTMGLQRSARQLGGIAASAFGAGFGGSVWAIVPTAEAAAFAERWQQANVGSQAFITRPADAANVGGFSDAEP